MGGAEVGTNDIVTIQYSKNGTVNWTRIYNGEDNLSDNAFGITVDNSDNIIITGSTTLFSTSQDFITIKYSQSGIQQWASVNNISENNSDVAYGVAVSNDGNVIYAAGSSTSANSNEKLALVKLNASGELVQSILYPSNGSASCISLNNDNDLFLGGYRSSNSSDGLPNKDFISMDFHHGSLIIIGISGNNNTIPEKFSLQQNYPNPFNPSTTIKFQVPTESFVELIVYDIMGKEIGKLVSSMVKAGEHTVEFKAGNLASGIYFYQLKTNTFSEIKKMILVK
jgi:hypothetical protein